MRYWRLSKLTSHWVVAGLVKALHIFVFLKDLNCFNLTQRLKDFKLVAQDAEKQQLD